MSSMSGFFTQCSQGVARFRFALTTREALRACFSREFILVKRHMFIYVFRTFQVVHSSTLPSYMYFANLALFPLNDASMLWLSRHEVPASYGVRAWTGNGKFWLSYMSHLCIASKKHPPLGLSEHSRFYG